MNIPPSDNAPEGHDAADSTLPSSSWAAPGRTIGPYLLLERIGTGGMGEVWKAEQRKPLRRIVALKLIKAGMDSREAVARFEAERQALALMEHPCIAKVFDAGTTPDGRPYFAMEYVQGTPITSYCDRLRLSTQDRLRLFRQVCEGVQHAHQKAVLHRDLKPSNVLVTEVNGRPLPKIIDFGVAKALAQPLTDSTMNTILGAMIGTPAYMSPEQAALTGSGVDTRADVYSLGVLLYELLVGGLPFETKDLRQAGLNGLIKMLREQDPPRPSTKISTMGKRSTQIAKSRRSEPRRLSNELKGDLDWIVMRCLEKEPNRRYGSSQELAQDIQRYLDHMPILAAPPTPVYLLSRFVRRNQVAVAVASFALLGLVGFLVWQSIQSRTIRIERDRAIANERLALAQVHVREDPTLATAYALSSLQIMDQPEARFIVRQALVLGPLYNRVPNRYLTRGNPLSVDASIDGRFLAVAWGGQTYAAAVYDLSDFSMQPLSGPIAATPSPDIAMIRFTRDGAHVVSVGRNGGIHVWSTLDGEHVMQAFADSGRAVRAVFPTDDPGRMLVSESVTGMQTSWYHLDVPENQLHELGRSRGRAGSETPTHRPAANLQGDRILDYEGDTLFLQSLEQLDSNSFQTIGRHDAPILAVAAAPDLERIASYDAKGTVRIWDFESGAPRLSREYRGEPGEGWLRFSTSDSDVLGLFNGPNAMVFDLSGGVPAAPMVFRDRTHWTKDGAFLPNGSQLTARIGLAGDYIGHWDKEPVTAWQLDLGDSSGQLYHSRFSQDGRRLDVWTEAGNLVRVNLMDPDEPSIRVVARTTPLNNEVGYFLGVSDDGRRLLTDNAGQGARVVDVTTGHIRPISLFTVEHLTSSMSPGGGRACFMDLPDGTGQDRSLGIVDLDAMNLIARLNPEGAIYHSTAFSSDSTLVALGPEHAVLYRIGANAAPPDTIWTGDSSTGGVVFRGGTALLVRDENWQLSLVDLRADRTTFLGTIPYAVIMGADWNSALGLCAVTSWSSSFQVYDVNSGRSWTVPFPETPGATVTIDPLGRWIVLNQDLQAYALRLPLDPLFADISADEFAERVQQLTNVRVVPRKTAPGYRVTSTLEIEQ